MQKLVKCLILNDISIIKVRSTAQKIKFSIKDFFSKYHQIRRKLRIWSYLLNKSLMENFFFCAVVQKRTSEAYSKLYHTSKMETLCENSFCNTISALHCICNTLHMFDKFLTSFWIHLCTYILLARLIWA